MLLLLCAMCQIWIYSSYLGPSLNTLVVALWKGHADPAQSYPCVFATAVKEKLLKNILAWLKIRMYKK